MRPTRCAAALGVALVCLSCSETTSSLLPYVTIDPILDSLFVGDQQPHPTVSYTDATGVRTIPSPADIHWASSDLTILAVDSLTGRVTGVKRGVAVLLATVHNVQGGALMVVSNTLDITLLLDTVYAMPGDTLTLPVAVLKRNTPPPPVVWFEAPTNAVYTIDSATGLLRALATGGPIPYFVHADTLVDTGGVSVLTLNDTTGGQFFFSVLGTVISHVSGSIRASNYKRSNGSLAFRLRGTHAPNTGVTQIVQITLPDSLTAAGTYAIDSLGLAEASSGLSCPAAISDPPRAWASWSAEAPAITAYSRPGGRLGVTQISSVLHGQAISGRFTYRAQRADLYTDSLGVLSIEGSFVAPLVTDQTSCK
jgi:hypothetical protein